jgi:hypothetical protein
VPSLQSGGTLLFAALEGRNEKAVTRKNLHRMQTKFYVAEEVGASLGRSEILQ